MKRVCVTVVAAVLVIFAVDFLAGPFFAFSTREWPAERHGDRVVGVIEGVVKRVDTSKRSVDVASGVLGLGTLHVLLGPETTLTVGSKLGGLPDLDRADFLRVTYEVQPSRLFAWRVDLIDRGSRATEDVVRRLIADVTTSAAVAASPAPTTSPLAAVPPRPRNTPSTRKPAAPPRVARLPRPNTPPAHHVERVAPKRPRTTQTATSRTPTSERLRSRITTTTRPPATATSPPPADNLVTAAPRPDLGVPIQLDLPYPVASRAAEDVPTVAPPPVSPPALSQSSSLVRRLFQGIARPDPARDPAATRSSERP